MNPIDKLDEVGLWLAQQAINLNRAVDRYKKKHGWIRKPPKETWIDRVGEALAGKIQKLGFAFRHKLGIKNNPH